MLSQTCLPQALDLDSFLKNMANNIQFWKWCREL